MKDTILLVHADIIAYRISAVSEERSILVTHKRTGDQKEFKTRTEFKKLLKSKDKIHNLSNYHIEDVQKAGPVENCIHSINSILHKLETNTFADKLELYLSGKDDNFRSNLPLPTQYKASRLNSIRPLLLNTAKEHLLNRHKARRAIKIEADDILSIRGYEELAKGNIAVIGSNDKDTYQSEGLVMYDFTQEKPELFEIPIIGELIRTDKKIYGYGLKFFAFQLLHGDPSDDYKPSQLAPGEYGAVSAYNDLNDLDFSGEILDAVVKRYKSWYPEPFEYTAWNGEVIKADWEFMLGLYFKCAYMKRTWNDPSDWKLFFTQRGYQG